MPRLAVQNLRVRFHTREGVVRAVEDVSYTVEQGETLGIVGESGSGKSVLQYAQLGLLPVPPARIESGQAIFDGADLLSLPPRELRRVRGRKVGMIFQDPMTALNPYLKVGAQLAETLRIHERASKQDAWRRSTAALESVGIRDAARRMQMYPHEFSGGMRQRVMIAMALSTQPALLIADEPTTALDVTVQAQILDLIKSKQQSLGMGVVLITHDLGVIAQVCDRVLVMYAGRILEHARVHDLFEAPKHPYTRALMDSLPAVNTQAGALAAIPGMPPDLSQPLPGCPFAPRCPFAEARCTQDSSPLAGLPGGRQTACARVLRGEIGPALQRAAAEVRA